MQEMEQLERRLGRLESCVEAASRTIMRARHAVLDQIYGSFLVGRVLSCIVCGRRGLRESFEMRISDCQFGGGRLERYACPNCDAVFGPMKILDMPAEELRDEYRLLYSLYSEADSTDSELRTFHSLKPAPQGIYLNWGCGSWAKTLGLLRDAGWSVWGYDPAAAPAQMYVATSRDGVSATFDGIFQTT